MVESHGTFVSAHCVGSGLIDEDGELIPGCGAAYTTESLRSDIFGGKIPKCRTEGCEGIIKPDITFFDEGLPVRFKETQREDFGDCDLVMVMGTALLVKPFCHLVKKPGVHVPRIVLNRTRVESKGLDFKSGRDYLVLGDCDDACMRLANLLGWKEDLERLILGDGSKYHRDCTAPMIARRILIYFFRQKYPKKTWTI